MEKFRINNWFRDYLRQFFESQVIPKRWRYPESIPRNAHGKIQKLEIQALFQEPDRDMTENASGFPQGITGTMLERSLNTGVFELFIPGESPYFDGHFPDFKLLSAAAQVDLALFCARRIFGPFSLGGAKRIKFSNAVFPDTTILVKLEKSRGILRFSIHSPKGISCSSGTFRLEGPA
jgi:hypothetical protein